MYFKKMRTMMLTDSEQRSDELYNIMQLCTYGHFSKLHKNGFFLNASLIYYMSSFVSLPILKQAIVTIILHSRAVQAQSFLGKCSKVLIKLFSLMKSSISRRCECEYSWHKSIVRYMLQVYNS